jgi:predicted transcriptional regulator of viral defense system
MKATQEQQFKKWFNRRIFTMNQVSVMTDIDRSNVCRFISKMKRSNSIYLVRRGICPITKDIAGFYTTNYNLYLTNKGLK